MGGDHTRPLSPRGLADAASLGAWLGAQGILPQQVFCSTATRTRETLEAIVRSCVGESRAAAHASGGMGATPPSVNLPTILRDKMYLASANELLAQVQGADDGVESLMLVGHNPGMHGLLALLVNAYDDEKDADRVIMKFPTAACAILRLEANSWKDVMPQSATLEKLRWSVDA